MKYKIKQEKGVTMIALVLVIIIIFILTGMLIYNAQDSIELKALTQLYNDIDTLRTKVSEYYNEYGKIPANIEYTDSTSLSKLSSVLSEKNDTGKFYVIDLQLMKGITLNYGKDYEKVKEDGAVGDYRDLYIINENSHNIFYIKGVNIEKEGHNKKYYTDYAEPDDTVIDLRYVDNVLIPDGYYYIGKIKDDSGNEYSVISDIQGEKIETSKENQYVWKKQLTEIKQIPSSVELEDNQNIYDFLLSTKAYKGYFLNSTTKKVRYSIINEEIWSEAYTKDCEYTDKNEDTITIPKGFRISLAPTMNVIDKGLVVKDSNDNEWVWIDVPKSIYTTATNSEDYENIKNDLLKYVGDYKTTITDAENYVDEWYALDGSNVITASTSGLTDTQKNLKTGCGLTYDEYNNLYNKMLSSVYKNKGFWISRYEIGGINNIPCSKKAPIYQDITVSEAQQIVNNLISSENKDGGLLFGIQWDLVCKFIENNATNPSINTENVRQAILEDSTDWGNYYNSEIYITDDFIKKKGYTMLLGSGQSDHNRILNTYELAGNAYEITLEYNKKQKLYIVRGGAAGSLEDESKIYNRKEVNIGKANGTIGFRASMY